MLWNPPGSKASNMQVNTNLPMPEVAGTQLKSSGSIGVVD